MSFDVAKVRKDFPIFERTIRDGKKLVYLDSGATSQKPLTVIDAESNFYKLNNAAVHRGAHQLAEEATDAYEGARLKVANFLGAKEDQIVFTKSATESLNLIAYAMGNAEPGSRFALSSKNRIVVTEMEHHANLIPWQQLAARTGAQLSWFEVTPDGRLDLSNINEVITEDTKLVALTHQSNVLGTINPLDSIVKRAHEVGAVVVLDACQSVPHMHTDVQEWDADFVVFSSHKMVGPSGIGILWGRESLLDAMPPFLGGGNMISDVKLEGFTCAELPAKFEAGTQPIIEAIGLGAAVDYLTAIGMDNVRAHEYDMTVLALNSLNDRFGSDITIHGSTDAALRGATISFAYRDVHPHDISQVLDQNNVCVRAGHHCAKPLMRILGSNATVRASFYLYNTPSDVTALCDALSEAGDFFTL